MAEADLRISAEERQRRQAAADNARGSLRLEGFHVSTEAQAIVAKYVNGDIEEHEVTEAILALHRPKVRAAP